MVLLTQPLQKLEIVFVSVWRTAWIMGEWMNMAPHSPCFEIHDSVPSRDSSFGCCERFTSWLSSSPFGCSFFTFFLGFSPYKSSWALHHFQDSSPYLVLQALYGITQLFSLLSFLHCNSIQLLVASPRDWALACVILCCKPFSGIFSLNC